MSRRVIKHHCRMSIGSIRTLRKGDQVPGAIPVSQHLWVQTVDATSSFNASNGDTQLSVLRGRSLSSRSTAVSSR
jgi:hypothetical protein